MPQLSIVVYNHYQAAFMLRWAEYKDATEDFMHADYFYQLHTDRVSKEVIGNIWENGGLLNDN